ncbi:leucine-rich repeat protein [Hepatocystis sp. ex Piliocolobus tephrosceles]|nr:leucine-rich repeat protein [Hepatocystis sp. ex Piliocolobus tephrosceles]
MNFNEFLQNKNAKNKNNANNKNNASNAKNAKGSSGNNEKMLTTHLEKKKKDIWSLFANVDTTFNKTKNDGGTDDGGDDDDDSIDEFFTPRNAQLRVDNSSLNNSSSRNNNTGLFKNTQENYAIRKEIEDIASSYKRKNNILLSDKSNENSDNILSNILTANKKLKINCLTNQINTSVGPKPMPSTNAYNEFLSKSSNRNLNEIKEKTQLLKNNLINNKINFQIDGDNVSRRIQKKNDTSAVNMGIQKDGSDTTSSSINSGSTSSSISGKRTNMITTRSIDPNTLVPQFLNLKKTGENEQEKNKIHTSVIKKKNICVNVNALNENKILHELEKKKKKKMNNFDKNDKFDIFENLGDDIFRYILSNIKNNKNIILLNKRFCNFIRSTRVKLIYNESLKNTIPPESILKTIYSSKNIKILDLSGCSHITSHHFSLLCNSNNIEFCNSLKYLSLKNCSKLNDTSLKTLLHRFKNLTALDIRNCYNITTEGVFSLKFKRALKKLFMGNLTGANVSNHHSNDTLNLLFNNVCGDKSASTGGATTSGATTSGATTGGASTDGASTGGATTSGITTSGATTSGTTISGATTFGATTSGTTISGATTFGATTSGTTTSGTITNTTDKKQSEHNYIIKPQTFLVNIECLEITFSKQLNDITLLSVIAKNLKILNLKGCSIDDSCSETLKELINLVALNIAETKISNKTITTICDHINKLKILDISKTVDLHVDTILLLSRTMNSLKKIKLSSLANVDNFCIREFLKYCKNLTCIDFANCWKVNNSFSNTNGLEVAAGDKLKSIGAFQCSIDRGICEQALSSVGCSSIRVHVHNELNIFETSIYTDIESL